MVCMMAAAPEPNRPASGKAYSAVAALQERWMRGIKARQLRDISLDGANDGSSQVTDQWIDPAKERTVGLCSAAHRLIDKFAFGNVQSAKAGREFIDRRKISAKVDRMNEPRVALEPARSVIASQAPSKRGIRPN